MAERHEEHQQRELTSLTELTTAIVAAYVSKNTIAVADLGPLIDSVGRQLRTLGRVARRMDGPSPQVLRIDFAWKPDQQPELPEPSQPNRRRRTWTTGPNVPGRISWAPRGRWTDEDEPTTEVAAVLLARLRDDDRQAPLAVRLNNLLIELGLPPGARAEIQPEQALAAFLCTHRARDAAGLAMNLS